MKMKVVLVASLVVMSLCSFFIGTVVGIQSVTWKAEPVAQKPFLPYGYGVRVYVPPTYSEMVTITWSEME